MLSNAPRILGVATILMIMFAASTVMVVGYFEIENAYSRLLLAKALSLLALAVFGQSEALKIYLSDNVAKEFRWITVLNQMGAGLAILVAGFLVLKIVIVEGGREPAWVEGVMSTLLKH